MQIILGTTVSFLKKILPEKSKGYPLLPPIPGFLPRRSVMELSGSWQLQSI